MFKTCQASRKYSEQEEKLVINRILLCYVLHGKGDCFQIEGQFLFSVMKCIAFAMFRQAGPVQLKEGLNVGTFPTLRARSAWVRKRPLLTSTVRVQKTVPEKTRMSNQLRMS